MDEPSEGILRFSGHWILTNVFVTQTDQFCYKLRIFNSFFLLFYTYKFLANCKNTGKFSIKVQTMSFNTNILALLGTLGNNVTSR